MFFLPSMCKPPYRCHLSSEQEEFLSLLFALCAQYQPYGIQAVSMGIKSGFYLIKVEMIQLSHSPNDGLD